MKKKRSKKKAVRRKEIIIFIVAVCAVAILAEVILVGVMLSGKEKRKKNNEDIEGISGLTKYERYGVINGRRLVVHMESCRMDSLVCKYRYDKNGRLTSRSYSGNPGYGSVKDKRIQYKNNGYDKIITTMGGDYADSVIFEDRSGIKVNLLDANYNFEYEHGNLERPILLSVSYPYPIWGTDSDDNTAEQRIVEWAYDDEGQLLQRKQTCIYQSGREVLESLIDYDGYDAKGRLTGYHEHGDLSDYTEQYIYRGDFVTAIRKNGVVTEETTVYDDYTVLYCREKDGVRTERTSVRINGSLPPSLNVGMFEGYSFVEYDSKGKKNVYTVVETNEDGQPAKCYHTDNSFERLFAYDDKGMCCEILERQRNGENVTETRKRLTFDEYGCLTEYHVIYGEEEDVYTDDVYYYEWTVDGPEV